MTPFEKRLKSHHGPSKDMKDSLEKDVDTKVYLKEKLNNEADRERSLYIHVPFCTKICSFCGFPKAEKKTMDEYHNLIINQIKSQRDFKYMEREINSIYFGGGTPTSLSDTQMRDILKCINDSYNIAPDCEVSVETSISELTPSMIKTLLNGGVNRLSIGIQTFNDNIRKKLNRRGSGDNAINKIKELKETGLTNVNIDLIYNNPGETLSDLKYDLDTIIDLELAGISFYSLMVYDKSPINSKITDEERQNMEDTEHDYKQFMLILETLRPHGFEMLELTKIIRDKLDKYKYITNSHNLGDCIAIGNGAGGKIGNYTYYNAPGAPTISDDVPISFMGKLFNNKYFTISKFMNDFQEMAVNLGEYNEPLNANLEELLYPTIKNYVESGLCTYENGLLKTTDKGIFWGNNIIDELVRVIVNKD